MPLRVFREFFRSVPALRIDEPYGAHEVFARVSETRPSVLVASLLAMSFMVGGIGHAQGQSPTPTFTFVPPAGGGASDRFGSSLASHEGTVVIGSPQRPMTIGGATNLAQGAAAIYRPGGPGYILEANLVALSGHANDFLGAAVDIVGDLVVAGAPGVDVVVDSLPLPNQLQAGGVFAWQSVGGTWSSPVLLKHPDPRSNDLFGSAVAAYKEVFGNGLTRHTLAIGASTDDHPLLTGGSRLDAGSVTVWEFEMGAWTSTAFIAMPAIAPESESSTAGALFGTSIRIDGKFLIVGAKRASPSTTSQGAVYVFRRSPKNDPAPDPIQSHPSWGDWVLVQRLTADAPEANDQFGTSIDAQQGRIIVGAPNRRAGSMLNAGAAYIYSRNLETEDYEWQASLIAADAQSGNLFGASVSIWSDRAAVGSPGVDAGTGGSQIPNRGSVYLYSVDEVRCAEWTQNTEYAPPLIAETPEANFGTAVRIEAERLFVTAPRAPGPNGTQQGSAFEFAIDTLGCAWDLNGDGLVDGVDLSLFFSHWGGSGPDDAVADYDGSLMVDGFDLVYCLGHWGPCQCGDQQPPP